MSAVPPLRLRPLRLEDEPAARAAHEELAADRFTFLLDWDPEEPWAGYVERMARWQRGEGVPDDRVRAAFLVAEVGGQLAGRASVRFALSEYLMNSGGHVGYGVRPAFRRRGLATEILRQALILLRADGVRRVLMTCDEGNAGSAAIIEAAGGVYEDTRHDAVDDVERRRFWIA